jgi:hypothetical protein
VQEDIDGMKKEMDGWRKENEGYSAQIIDEAAYGTRFVLSDPQGLQDNRLSLGSAQTTAQRTPAAGGRPGELE